VIESLKRDTTSYAYAGQYQQRPAPREGGMFKRAWFADKIIGSAPAGTKWVRHWDLAATAKKTAARTAGVKLGKTPDGKYVVGHVVKIQEEGNAVRKTIMATAQTDGRGCEISLPQDPGQAGKVQKADLIAMLAGYVARAEPETGDKVDASRTVRAQCEAGNVYLVKDDWNRVIWTSSACSQAARSRIRSTPLPARSDGWRGCNRPSPSSEHTDTAKWLMTSTTR
jgi:predicted phage terminase large subunit-like protein